MNVTFSNTQKQRLLELDAKPQALAQSFASESERNACFDYLAKELSEKNLDILTRLRTSLRRPVLNRIATQVTEALVEAGFVEVTTPVFLAKGLLKKMNMAEGDALWKQIFWIDENRCLRPMLAPNLYFLLGHLQRLWSRPICLFEIGSCWRKESTGAHHMEEFTMLNLVELGCLSEPQEGLVEIADLVMGTFGLSYDLVKESSQVYGFTMDVVCDGVEVASGATGPYPPLDGNWNVSESWAGLGVGLERLAMLVTGNGNIHRVGRSLIYLDGARLNI